MKKRSRLPKWFAAIMCTSLLLGITAVPSYAAESTKKPEGKVYEFGEKDHYTFSSSSDYTTTTSGAKTYGSFRVEGDITKTATYEGVTSYCVGEGNLTLSYQYSDALLNANEDAWHVISDKSKDVDTFKLSDNISKGAIILQTSRDRHNWVDAYVETNAFNNVPIRDDSFYMTTDVQEVSGCFYRVIVVYEIAMRTENNKVLPDKYDYKKYAEVYEFYAYDTARDEKEPASSTMYRLGETKKSDKSYTSAEDIGIKDDHYNWELGNFYVSGFTEKKEDSSRNPVFLKNVGDEVTLWFKLTQDINCLGGNSNLAIYDNDAGYDEYFKTPRQDFGRGALIIRYTDYQNEPRTETYVNYLEANATLGANTKVQLFEEGDYEVALDYEVVNKKGVDTYTHYRIFFKFSVRNANCMVYPFDLVTGAELTNGAMTPNGFYLDLANSRYLSVTLKREVLKDGMDGLTEDTRLAQSAKDGDKYTIEGIYTITAKNPYNQQETTKRIYVGTNNVLKAYMTTGLSIKEIQTLIDQGATILDDGTIEMPEPETEPETESEIVPESPTEETSVSEPESTETTVSEVTNTVETSTETNEQSTETVVEAADDNHPNKTPIVPISIGAVALVAVGGSLVFKKKRTTDGGDAK